MKCKSCGNETPYNNLKGYCQSCYVYFSKGGKIHPLPPIGEVAKTEDGKVICHICGKAYTKLGAHIFNFHHITMKEYKDSFGICRKTKMTEDKYSDMMSKLAYKYNMPSRLRVLGKNTRFTSEGQKGGRRVFREQEVKMRAKKLREYYERKKELKNG